MYYHLLIDGVQTGPLSLHQIRQMWNSGQITIETLYWTESATEWMPLSSIQTLLENQRVEFKTRPNISNPDNTLKKQLLYDSQKKSVAVACILNAMLPGVGLMYAGKPVLGFLLLLLTVGSLALAMALPVFALFSVFCWIGGIVDGYKHVEQLNANLAQEISQ